MFLARFCFGFTVLWIAMYFCNYLYHCGRINNNNNGTHFMPEVCNLQTVCTLLSLVIQQQCAGTYHTWTTHLLKTMHWSNFNWQQLCLSLGLTECTWKYAKCLPNKGAIQNLFSNFLFFNPPTYMYAPQILSLVFCLFLFRMLILCVKCIL